MSESEKAAAKAFGTENLAATLRQQTEKYGKPVEAIEFATGHIENDHDAMNFLRSWSEGDFTALEQRWPEFPAAVRK